MNVSTALKGTHNYIFIQRFKENKKLFDFGTGQRPIYVYLSDDIRQNETFKEKSGNFDPCLMARNVRAEGDKLVFSSEKFETFANLV